MTTASYDDGYAAHRASEDAPHERYLGEHIFLWVAWALAFALWSFTVGTFFGILNAVSQPSPGVAGGVDAGGVAYLVMDVIGGLLVLGAALACGMWAMARRNRRLDPVTEAATAALYDQIERQGGEDMTSRSPDAERHLR